MVFLDPPYKMKVIVDLINAMEVQAIIEANTTIVVEHDAKDVLDDVIGGFEQQRRADYGDTAVTIYKQSVGDE